MPFLCLAKNSLVASAVVVAEPANTIPCMSIVRKLSGPAPNRGRLRQRWDEMTVTRMWSPTVASVPSGGSCLAITGSAQGGLPKGFT